MSITACHGTILSLLLPRLGFLPHLPGDAALHWPRFTDPVVVAAVIVAVAYALVRIRREVLESAIPPQPSGMPESVSAGPPMTASTARSSRLFGVRRGDRANALTTIGCTGVPAAAHAAKRTATLLPFRARRDEAPVEVRAIAA